MTMNSADAEAGRVVRVDFANGRRGQRSGGGKTPDPRTIAAVAQLVVEHSAPAAIESEVETLCTLLRLECGWSEESLSRLRTVTALVRATRQPRRVRTVT